MSNHPNMSYQPFDSTHSSRSNYPQPVYGQPGFGHMGYADMSSGQRYHPSAPLQYPPESSSGSGQYANQESYVAPSFSPTSSQFAQAAQPYGAPPNSDAMSYAPPRKRIQSESRYPVPRHPSDEGHMPAVQEAHEFVPSQVPSQPFYDTSAPVSRHAPNRSSSTGQSLTTSALALEKPYVCDICQTRFARHHDCRRHRETHVVNASGEKPHHCVVCGKSFTRKDALKRHTNQKGCDINAVAPTTSRSSRSSSSSSPQQAPGTFYPVGNLPHYSGY